MDMENSDNKYTLSEQRLTSEQSNLNLNNKSLTLSQTTYYNKEKSKKSFEKIQNNCSKFRYLLNKFVKNKYFQLILIILSIYALIDREFLLLFLPKYFDYAFHRLIECVFFMYLLEFVLLLIGKNHYCGSFDFYLDIFAVISIVTETEIIWKNFMHEVVETSYNVETLTSFSNFEKAHIANSVGSRATKYVKLLNLLNYIKVIRIAKIVRNTKELTLNLIHVRIDNQFNNSITILDKIRALGIRFRRKPVIPSIKISKNKLAYLESKSSQLCEIKESIEDMESSINDKNDIITSPKIKSNEKLSQEDFNVMPHHVLNIRPNLNMTLHEFALKRKQRISQDFHKENKTKFEEIYKKHNRFISSPINNFQLSDHHYSTTNKSLVLLNNDSSHEDSSINYQKINSKSISKSLGPSVISEEPDDYMDEIEEKKVKSRVEIFKSLSNQIKIENKEDKEQKLGKADTKILQKTKDISHNMNSKLEKRLLENVYKQILFLIVFIVVALPTIDIDFLFSLINTDVVHLNKHEYCLSLIFMYMNSSLYNNKYLTNLNKTIVKCFNDTEDSTAEFRNLIFLTFNESSVFYELKEKTGFLGQANSISISNFSDYEKKYRKDIDYYTNKVVFDNYNNLTYVYDNRNYIVVASITSLLYSFYISIMLIITTYYANYTIQNVVIMPLDIIFTKLQLNLKHVEIDDKNIKILEDEFIREANYNRFENKENFQNSLMDEFCKNHTTIDTPLKLVDKKKGGLETQFINKSIVQMLDMISSSIGKFAYLLVPYLELERDHSLEFKTPSVEFDGYALFLNITNTDRLISEYSELSYVLLSRIYTLFHCIGIIFLGEPYNKTNTNAIIWKKGRKEWLAKMNQYALSVLNIRQLPEEIFALDISKGSIEEKDQIYDIISADLCVFCGVKFFYDTLKNLNRTFELLKECNVCINLFITYGKVNQILYGNNENLDQIYFGEIIEEYNLISRNINYHHQYPSIFLSEKIICHISEEIKKYIFPFDTINLKNNKQIKLYRHYFNYNSTNNELIKDCFNFKKLRKEKIFQKRSNFENYILKNNKSFINFVISDDSYVEVVSKLNPTLRNLVNFAFEAIENKQYDSCIKLIKDLKNLTRNQFNNDDYIFTQKIFKLEEVVDSIQQQKKASII